MRIAVSGMWHESNSFSSDPTTLESFASKCLKEGEAIFDYWRNTESEVQGYLQAATTEGIDLVPLITAWAWPAGPVTADCYRYVTAKLFDGLTAADVDGALICLHGAMVVEGVMDPEGEILSRAREILGPDRPIVATLDFHANVSALMVRMADALIGYDTYPHIDFTERGMEAARLIARIVRGEVRPTSAMAHPPLAPVPQRQWTAHYPMYDVMQRVFETEREDGVLCASAYGGFCYADVPHAGLSVTVTTDHDPAQAQRLANEIAAVAWERRADFTVSLPDARTAVAEAMRESSGLTVLVDIGDNIGGGTPGDGPTVLRELLGQGAQGAVDIICDPAAVQAAIASGVGATVALTVGGKTDRHHGSPVEVTGRVRLISDGIFVNRGKMRDGATEEMGQTVVLECGGVTVVLTSRKLPPWNLQQLRSLGIEPTALRILNAKSAIAFRAAYEPISQRIIEMDTPGVTAVNLGRFDYRHLQRPVYPLDPECAWQP